MFLMLFIFCALSCALVEETANLFDLFIIYKKKNHFWSKKVQVGNDAAAFIRDFYINSMKKRDICLVC